MGLADWISSARGLIEEQVSRHAETLRGHVNIDVEGRRLFVADPVISKLLGMAVATEGMELISLEHRGESHELSLKIGGGPVSATVTLREVRWAGDEFSVVVETPQPPTLAERPLITWLVSAIAHIMGGTQLAERTFALALPETLQWDGKKAVATFRLPTDRRLPPGLLPAGPLVLPINTADPSGLWFSCAEVSVLNWLFRQICAQVVRVVVGRFIH
jgi:hypothetical protein